MGTAASATASGAHKGMARSCRVDGAKHEGRARQVTGMAVVQGSHTRWQAQRPLGLLQGCGGEVLQAATDRVLTSPSTVVAT